MKSNNNNLTMKGTRVVYDDGNSNSSKPDDSGSHRRRQSANRSTLNNGHNSRERSDRTDGDRSGSHVVSRSYSEGWRKVNRGASRHGSRPNSREAGEIRLRPGFGMSAAGKLMSTAIIIL